MNATSSSSSSGTHAVAPTGGAPPSPPHGVWDSIRDAGHRMIQPTWHGVPLLVWFSIPTLALCFILCLIRCWRRCRCCTESERAKARRQAIQMVDGPSGDGTFVLEQSIPTAAGGKKFKNPLAHIDSDDMDLPPITDKEFAELRASVHDTMTPEEEQEVIEEALRNITDKI